MVVLSKEFANDPCSKIKREKVIKTARTLLASVTHLLILADFVDVQFILKSIRLVCSSLLFYFRIVLFFSSRLKTTYNVFMMHLIKKN